MTAFVDNARSFSSTHSVEPIRPASSAPQLQNLMVRLGRQPLEEYEMLYGDNAGGDDCGDDVMMIGIVAMMMMMMILVMMMIVTIMVLIVILVIMWLQ